MAGTKRDSSGFVVTGAFRRVTVQTFDLVTEREYAIPIRDS